jgi:signal transduction histidine kinase/ligand-binding sensor domain-containing protein
MLKSTSVAVFAFLVTITLLAAACGSQPSLAGPEPVIASTPVEAMPADTDSDSVIRRPLYSQGDNLRFEHISMGTTFSQSAIHRIFQDSRGFIWLGTEDGLVKYDGYELTIYRHDATDAHSLGDNHIQTIYEDRAGVLWVGTGSGLERFDHSNGQFTHYDMYGGVISIFEGESGTFWVGAPDALFAFDQDIGEFTRARMGAVTSINQDQTGALWFGTRERGLDRYDPDDGALWEARYDIDLITHYDAYDPGSLSSNVILAVYEDEAGELWIGTHGGGLNRFDPRSEQFTYYQNSPNDPLSLSHDVVTSIAADQWGALWIGTYGGGLNRLDRATGQFTRYQHNTNDPYSLSSDLVFSVYQDQGGLLWIGMEDGQVDRLDLSRGGFSHYQYDPHDADSLGHNDVRAFYADGERYLWIGTNGGGLDRFDRQSGEWHRFRHDPDDASSLSSDFVYVIDRDPSGTLWIGTDCGLDRYDPLHDQFSHYPIGAVASMSRDQSGAVWIANESRLHRCSLDLEECVQVRQSRYTLVQIVEDRSGGLWIATNGDGLLRLVEGQFTRYTKVPGDPHSLSSNAVWAVHEDPSGVLWVGTDEGLDRFDPSSEIFTHFATAEGLAGNSVRGILQDETGALWLGTDRGLNSFDPQTETFRSYDVSDGVQDDDFNVGACFKSSSGEMFFGGTNGFNAFYPQQIGGNLHVPPVVITAFNLFNETVRTDLSPDETIELAHNQNSVSFEFAALDYSDPERNQYAYWMEGVDENWVVAGTSRRADYPNLPPGEYVFRVRGSNNDGVWSEEGTAVAITIKPPLWGTWWFRSITFLVLAVGAVGVYRLRVRSVEARTRDLEIQVQQRTTELEREVEQRMQVEKALQQSELDRAVAAERSRLSRELHDAVTQTLFSASLIAQALPITWERDQEEGRELLNELRQLNRGALAEMRALLLELRPAVLVETKLDDLFNQLAEAIAGREGIPVTAKIDGECTLPPNVHMVVYRIAQEALNNVVKHARASWAEISLSCISVPSARGDEEQGKRMKLVVEDDGRGFDPSKVSPDHLGLGIMRERAQSIGATLEIDSKSGHGTQVTLVWTTEEERK